jgi:hypothetical protein
MLLVRLAAAFALMSLLSLSDPASAQQSRKVDRQSCAALCASQQCQHVTGARKRAGLEKSLCAQRCRAAESWLNLWN